MVPTAFGLQVARQARFVEGPSVPELDVRAVDLRDDPSRSGCVRGGGDGASLVEGRDLDKARVGH